MMYDLNDENIQNILDEIEIEEITILYRIHILLILIEVLQAWINALKEKVMNDLNFWANNARSFGEFIRHHLGIKTENDKKREENRNIAMRNIFRKLEKLEKIEKIHEDEIKLLKEKYDKVVNELKEQIKNKDLKMEKMQRQYEEVKKENRELKIEIKELKLENSQLKGQIQILNTVVFQQAEELKRQSKAIDELEKRLDEKDEIISKRSLIIEKQNDKIDELEKRLDEKDEIISKQSLIIEKQNDKIDEIMKRLDNLNINQTEDYTKSNTEGSFSRFFKR